MAEDGKLRRVKLEPDTVRRGEIFTVKTLAEHVMEPGVRMDPETNLVYPRFIIQKFICRYNGRQVFSAEWFSGVSANPFMAFKVRAEHSGEIEIIWIDDYLGETRAAAMLTVLDDGTGDDGDVGDSDPGRTTG